jgi:ADP-ribose pyrophosphatase YjhB (NUDIX family)
MLYFLLKKCVALFFSLFNVLLGGKLPPFGSACMLVEENGRYLAVATPRGTMTFPGGFMTWRETPQQTAEREGLEETGLTLQVDYLINYYSCPSDRFTRMSTISFAFHGKVVGGELRNNMEGRPLWLTLDELRPLLRGHAESVLDDYLRTRSQHRPDSLVAPLIP